MDSGHSKAILAEKPLSNFRWTIRLVKRISLFWYEYLLGKVILDFVLRTLPQRPLSQQVRHAANFAKRWVIFFYVFFHVGPALGKIRGVMVCYVFSPAWRILEPYVLSERSKEIIVYVNRKTRGAIGNSLLIIYATLTNPYVAWLKEELMKRFDTLGYKRDFIDSMLRVIAALSWCTFLTLIYFLFFFFIRKCRLLWKIIQLRMRFHFDDLKDVFHEMSGSHQSVVSLKRFGSETISRVYSCYNDVTMMGRSLGMMMLFGCGVLRLAFGLTLFFPSLFLNVCKNQLMST